MGRKLLDIVLGTCLAFVPLSIVEKPMSLESVAYCQETAAVGKPLPKKAEYTFEEFRQALGKRYETLTDAEKRQVKQNFFDEKFVHQVDYKSLIPLLYGDSKSSELVDEDEGKSLNCFKIQNIQKEKLKEYLRAFPWIKEFEIQNIDKIAVGTPNPDRILLWLEETLPHFELNFDLDYLIPVAMVASFIEKEQEYLVKASECISRSYVDIFRIKERPLKIYFTDIGMPYDEDTEFVLTSKGLIFPREEFKKSNKD